MMRRRQYSLRALLAFVTICAVLLAVVATLGADFVRGFSGFVYSCGFVVLVAFACAPLDRLVAKIPRSTVLILIPALYCLVELAFYLFGQAIDQPHPRYSSGNWVTVALSRIVPGLPFIATGVFLLVAMDSAVQTARPCDSRYYPCLANLRTVHARVETRLALTIGTMLVLGYYAFTVAIVWRNEQLPATVWPPQRVFIACNLLWGVLWLTDCLSRPQKGTIVAAGGFLVLAFYFLLPMGFVVLRE